MAAHIHQGSRHKKCKGCELTHLTQQWPRSWTVLNWPNWLSYDPEGEKLWTDPTDSAMTQKLNSCELTQLTQLWHRRCKRCELTQLTQLWPRSWTVAINWPNWLSYDTEGAKGVNWPNWLSYDQEAEQLRLTDPIDSAMTKKVQKVWTDPNDSAVTQKLNSCEPTQLIQLWHRRWIVVNWMNKYLAALLGTYSAIWWLYILEEQAPHLLTHLWNFRTYKQLECNCGYETRNYRRQPYEC